jgi:hypothetical protein
MIYNLRIFYFQIQGHHSRTFKFCTNPGHYIHNNIKLCGTLNEDVI